MGWVWAEVSVKNSCGSLAASNCLTVAELSANEALAVFRFRSTILVTLLKALLVRALKAAIWASKLVLAAAENCSGVVYMVLSSICR